MTKPIPPMLYGIITPASIAVEVSGHLQGAVVTLFRNGSETVGSGVPDTNNRVAIENTLVENDNISATQALNGETSKQSPPVVVLGMPTSLPRLSLSTFPSTMLSSALYSQTISGATVFVRNAQGQDVAKGTAFGTFAFVEFDLSIPLQIGEELSAFQAIGGAVSPEEKSPPLVSTMGRSVPNPVLQQPLMSCATDQTFLRAEPAAITEIVNSSVDGAVTQQFNYVNPDWAFQGTPSPALIPGKLVARQRYPRTHMQSEEVVYEVVPRQPPHKPFIQNEYCYLIQKLKLAGLNIGAIITIERQTSKGVVEAIAVAGAQYGVQDFVLPRDAVGDDTSYLRAMQTICGVESEWSDWTPLKNGIDPAEPQPRIVGPVYGCSNVIRIINSRPGHEVQAFDADTGQPLCDPVIANTNNVVLFLYGDLQFTGTKRVRVYLNMCAGELDVLADVEEVPEPFPMAAVKSPVRPGWKSVEVRDCLIGAWIELYVDGSFRRRIKATDLELTLSLPGGQEFKQGDEIFVRQRLCNRYADCRPLSVTKGKMYGKATPAQVSKDQGTTVVIYAIDAEFGSYVSGLRVELYPNYQPSLTSGNGFLFPGYGDQPEAIKVIIHGEPAYNDSSLMIPVGAAKAFTQNLSLHLRNDPYWSTYFKVTKAVWSVTWEWAAGDSGALEGMDVTAEVPAFPQGTSFGNAYVSLKVDWEAGGVIDGAPISPTSGTDVVAFDKLPVGWPDPGYSGIFSVTVGWKYHQTKSSQSVEPLFEVIKDAESIND